MFTSERYVPSDRRMATFDLVAFYKRHKVSQFRKSKMIALLSEVNFDR